MKFIVCCLACDGAVIDVVPVEPRPGDDGWGEAEKWAYVAQVEHDIAVHGRPRPVHPARRGQLELAL